jgi:hypothetical protein
MDAEKAKIIHYLVILYYVFKLAENYQKGRTFLFEAKAKIRTRSSILIKKNTINS